MYIDYSIWETYEYKVSALQLDLNNPRIRYMGDSLNQTQVLKVLLEKEKVYELAKKNIRRRLFRRRRAHYLHREWKESCTRRKPSSCFFKTIAKSQKVSIYCKS